ncbi:MAG: 4-(cytidine 5'-diphospho)-2-C-methyl-D-erythritol kinase [Candidatus Geothermincolales bacterium]
MERRIALEAPAKINIFLKVGERRPDGYHSILTLFQAVDLCDLVEVELSSSGVEIVAEGHVPQGEENLCVRAARAFERLYGGEVGARIRLHKRIPVGAGLGGGSSDAAAVLVGLNLLLGEPLNREDLERAAAEIGSDVPFFLSGGTAEARGRGELLQRLPSARGLLTLLLNPGFSLSTAEVYREFDRLNPSPGPLGDIPEGLKRGLETGDAGLVGKHIRNDLVEAALELAPVLRPALERLGREGPCGMSGSGPTLFLLSGDEEALVRAGIRLAFPWSSVVGFRDSGVAPL